jgi:hypothetical protein
MAKKNYYLSGVLSPSEKPGIWQVILAILARSSVAVDRCQAFKAHLPRL